MNFFQQQDIARRNTRRLVVLFVLAVLALVALTNLFLLLFPWQLNSAAFTEHGSNRLLLCLFDSRCAFWSRLDWGQVLLVSLLVVSVIGLVSLFKWLQVSKGGRAVAEMMGGVMVRADTTDFAEKRLLNIVEEMALAAGMPVPAVYVLRNEPGLNAFAAGFSHRDAVIAVTGGMLETMNRDQLQGVIAHEFSHILNGDMRLNMRLVAVLHGILFITEAGFVFLRGNRHSYRSRHSGPAIMLGLGLVVIGAIGTFFGNLIKAAVSRQREFLADASAVQFTRNPTGIADALKVIGSAGSMIEDKHGSEISHFFFCAALSRAQSLLATHPPLEERIRRIEPQWNGRFIKPSAGSGSKTDCGGEGEQQTHRDKLATSIAVMSAAGVAGYAGAGEKDEAVRFDSDALHQPLTAAAAVLCLLYHSEQESHRVILARLKNDWPALYQAMQDSHWFESPRQDFLPIVELAVSGLRLLQEQEYRLFKRTLMQFVQADGRVDMYEWALFQLLQASVDSHFQPAAHNTPKYRHISAISKDIQLVLAVFVRSASDDKQTQLQAFYRGCNTAGIYQPAVEALPEADMARFSQAVKRIACAYPLLKPRVIKALVDAAKSDHRIDSIEQQCIVAISAVIDAPIADVMLRELGLATA